VPQAVSPFTVADTNNDVGGTPPLQVTTLSITGGAPGATNEASAIRTLNQYGLNIGYNTINNNNGLGVNHPTTLHGIFNNTATGAGATITNNTIINGFQVLPPGITRKKSHAALAVLLQFIESTIFIDIILQTSITGVSRTVNLHHTRQHHDNRRLKNER